LTLLFGLGFDVVGGNHGKEVGNTSTVGSRRFAVWRKNGRGRIGALSEKGPFGGSRGKIQKGKRRLRTPKRRKKKSITW